MVRNFKTLHTWKMQDTAYLACCIILFSTTFIWFWSIRKRNDWSKVLLLSKGTINDKLRPKSHDIAFTKLINIFNDDSFSCLPAWSKTNFTEFAYVGYVCVGGGIFPAVILISSHMYIMKILDKVIISS